jgi:phage gpG-like protein
MKIKVIIDGVKDARRALNYAVKGTPNQVFKTVKKIMGMLDKEVQRNLRGGNPLFKKSNRLASGIYVDVSYNSSGNVEGIIGTDVFYGILHEEGGNFTVPAHQMKLDHFFADKVIDILGVPYITVTRGPYIMKIPPRPWFWPAVQRVMPQAQQMLWDAGIAIRDR